MVCLYNRIVFRLLYGIYNLEDIFNMIFTKEDVSRQCKAIAPKYNFDPELIYAVCLQESDKDEKGNFDPDVARLEQGYYLKYVEKKNNLATTTEILLSASYGVMQMLGDSLKQAKYFDWYFTKFKDLYNLTNPLSEIAVPKALNFYCVNLDVMIDFGCIWMDIKRSLAKGDIRKTLAYWNGSPEYPDKIFARMKSINSEELA